MHQPENHFDIEKKLNGGQILLIVAGLIILAVLMILKLYGILVL